MSKKRNYARFYCLLAASMPELDREEAKELVAHRVSDGRTDSLRDLTDREWQSAMRMVEGIHDDRTGDLRRARSRALKQLQLYGIKTTDWDEVNRFVAQPKIAGKSFYNLDEQALESLTRKMRAINAKKSKGDDPTTTKVKASKSEKKYTLFYIKSDNQTILIN